MDAVQKAFRTMPRQNFLPDNVKQYAHDDTPLPIGYGQTNSQPSTVRMMLEWLNVQMGDKILDVGSGSGWTTALLAALTGPTGIVYAVELIPQLVSFGRQNCKDLGLQNVRFFEASNVIGLPSHGPYDRILVSASAEKLPDELLDQLKVGGTLVIPVGYDIIELTRTKRGYNKETHSGFQFVPLLHT